MKALEERTPQEIVEAAWQRLLHASWYPNPELFEARSRLILEASRRPQLRRLFPFTSHFRLGISTTTFYPWEQLFYIYPRESDRESEEGYTAFTTNGSG